MIRGTFNRWQIRFRELSAGKDIVWNILDITHEFEVVMSSLDEAVGVEIQEETEPSLLIDFDKLDEFRHTLLDFAGSAPIATTYAATIGSALAHYAQNPSDQPESVYVSIKKLEVLTTEELSNEL